MKFTQKKIVVLLVALTLLLSAGLAYGQCAPKVFNLTAGASHGEGSGTVIGTVSASNDATNLYVRYDVTSAGWYLKETHVTLCHSPFNERPDPELSHYNGMPAQGATTFTQVIPRLGANFFPASLEAISTLYYPPDCFDIRGTVNIAAEADVTGPNGVVQAAYGGLCVKPDNPKKAWFGQLSYTIPYVVVPLFLLLMN